MDAKAHFAFDESLPFHTLPRTLRSLLPAHDNIYVDIFNPSSRRSSPRSILKYLSSSEPRSEYDTIMEALNSSRRKPLAPVVAKLRSIKSPAEQAVMRAAADISGIAFAKVDLPFIPSTTQHNVTFTSRQCDSPSKACLNIPSHPILNTYAQLLVHKDQPMYLSLPLGR